MITDWLSSLGRTGNRVQAELTPREFPLPDAVLNAALLRYGVQGDIRRLSVACHAGCLTLDIAFTTPWAQVAVSGDFRIDDFHLDGALQRVLLAQQGRLRVQADNFAAPWQGSVYRLLSPVSGWLAERLLKHFLLKLKGTRILRRHYRFDLSHYIPAQSWLALTARTVPLHGARCEPGTLVLLGHVDVLGVLK